MKTAKTMIIQKGEGDKIHCNILVSLRSKPTSGASLRCRVSTFQKRIVEKLLLQQIAQNGTMIFFCLCALDIHFIVYL